MLRRKKEKLIATLGGIRNMKSLPDMIFVVDTVKEKIAVQEANRLKIPVVAPIDTNCDPDVVEMTMLSALFSFSAKRWLRLLTKANHFLSKMVASKLLVKK